MANKKTTTEYKNSIWLIPVITSLINLLAKFALGITNEWVIFLIFASGFVLIAILTYFHYLEQRIEKKMKFLREMVQTEETDPNGTKKKFGRIDENSIGVIRELAGLR